MNVTPWFPGTVKPVRPGVYQRMLNVEIVYAYFDGRHWFNSSPSFVVAKRNGRFSRFISGVQNTADWRGVLQ